MGQAIDTITGTVTAPGATITALVAAAGDSYAVRNTNPGVGIWLLSMWANNNVAGVFRLRSPRLHDNVQGIRTQVFALTPLPLIAHSPVQRLYPQDTLIAELSGSGVAGQIESGILMLYYEDLPGVQARMMSPDQLQARGVNVLTVEVDVAPGAGGGYTGSSALNKTTDVLIANMDYALLGATFSAAVGAATIKGADSGNLRQPIPGIATMPQFTRDWFWRVSRFTGLPLIPIYNSANKAGITIEGVQTQAAGAFNVSLNFVQLAPGGATVPQIPKAPS